jgi:pilus assembly protein Flp/PilA
MVNKLKALVTGEEGQGLTEYGLVLGIIAVAVVGIIVSFRAEIQEMFTGALRMVENRETGGVAPTP